VDEILREKIIHTLAGGGISFISIFFTESIFWLLMDYILRTLGIYGVLAYQEGQEAFFLIGLGSVYLLSGFLGGLYVGYKIKEGLKTLMVFPAIICLLGMVVLQFLTGTTFPIANFTDYFIRAIVIPLSVLITGSYLGGYTLNWHVEEKPEEERIELIFREE